MIKRYANMTSGQSFQMGLNALSNSVLHSKSGSTFVCEANLVKSKKQIISAKMPSLYYYQGYNDASFE
jgi:hypothetical protein